MKRGMLETSIREEQAMIRTRVQLALVNMAVLAVIWTVASLFVYGIENHESLMRVDGHLLDISRQLVFDRRQTDPDCQYVIWQDSPLRPIAFSPAMSQENIQLLQSRLAAGAVDDGFTNVTTGGISYRVLQISHWQDQPHVALQLMEDVRDDKSLLARLQSLLIWGGAIALLLTVLGGFLLGVWTLRPLVSARRREQELLSDVAHELRTPLAALNTHAELLLRHAEDPIAEHIQWVDAIYSETKRMSRLVRDLLELSRLEAGEHTLELELVSLHDLCESVAMIYQPVLEEAGLRFVLDADADAKVMGDVMRLQQLLLIFLDNARKYTPTGSITLRLIRHGSQAELRIQDTGQGMAPELLKKATERFVRGDLARQGGESTGLGLAIARGIVKAHHGRLTIRSQAGTGTEVVIGLRCESST